MTEDRRKGICTSSTHVNWRGQLREGHHPGQRKEAMWPSEHITKKGSSSSEATLLGISTQLAQESSTVRDQLCSWWQYRFVLSKSSMLPHLVKGLSGHKYEWDDQCAYREFSRSSTDHGVVSLVLLQEIRPKHERAIRSQRCLAP